MLPPGIRHLYKSPIRPDSSAFCWATSLIAQEKHLAVDVLRRLGMKMIEPSNPYSEGPREMLDGIGVFLFGVCIAAAGWFTTATSLRALSKDVPLDAGVFGIVGLEAGAIASAYLFAWAFRRRLYWFFVYLLTSTILLSLSYTGTRLSFSAYLHHQQLEQTSSMASLVDTLRELRHGKPQDTISFFLAASAIGLPLLGFLGARPARRSLPERLVAARVWMKELSNQIQSCEGVFTWFGQTAKTLLFNRQQADPRVADFQRQVRRLRETVASSLGSLPIPDFIQEALSLRLTDMCGKAESTAFAAQGKLDQVGLLALSDCLDAVQLSELPEQTKQEVKQVLVGHFQQFHEVSRDLTRAQERNQTVSGKEISTNVRSKKTISAQA